MSILFLTGHFTLPHVNQCFVCSIPTENVTILCTFYGIWVLACILTRYNKRIIQNYTWILDAK